MAILVVFKQGVLNGSARRGISLEVFPTKTVGTR
jgi:hypothetical protein